MPAVTSGLVTYGFFVDGHFEDTTGDEEVVVVNPATEDVVGRVGSASMADLERAVGEGARVTYSAGSSGEAPVDPIVGARGEGAVPLFQHLGVALRLP